MAGQGELDLMISPNEIYIRSSDPFTEQDFALLYNAIKGENWRLRNHILPGVVYASKIWGLNTKLMLAQSILETGWGKSEICVLLHNTAGMKRVDADGDEFDDFQPFANFAAGTMGQSAHLWRYSSRPYERLTEIQAVGMLLDSRAVHVPIGTKALTVTALARTWATDPEYANKIAVIYEKLL